MPKALTPARVVSYLLDQSLASPEDVLTGGLSITNVSRRNRDFAVERSDGSSYFLKQAARRHFKAALAHEAAVYRFLSGLKSPVLAKHLPRFHRYDASKGILVLELYPRSRSLAEEQLRTGRFPPRCAAQFAVALAELHRLTQGHRRIAPGADGSERISFGAAPPTALSFHRPEWRSLSMVSRGNLRLLAEIQAQPSLCAELDRLRAAWTPTALIHNDVKADNVLLTGPPEQAHKSLRLIDWETARAGEPAWDLASAFSDYLSFWIMSIPVLDQDVSARLLQRARYPLARIQPALRAFWEAYRRQARLDPAQAEERLARAMRYLAPALIAAAYQQLAAALDPTPHALCLLQLAVNVLRRPGSARTALFGSKSPG